MIGDNVIVIILCAICGSQHNQVNEKQNYGHNRMRSSLKVGTLTTKSVFLAWVQRCEATRNAMLPRVARDGISIGPRRLAERQVPPS